MKHDGVINMIIHGRKHQVGFLEVAGNAFDKDITNRNIDLKKLYKDMPDILLFFIIYLKPFKNMMSFKI